MVTREGSKRPHAATWLNGARWEDEIEAPTQEHGGTVYREVGIPDEWREA
jgi:hypothetical protein